jgi:hypothetical protein
MVRAIGQIFLKLRKLVDRRRQWLSCGFSDFILDMKNGIAQVSPHDQMQSPPTGPQIPFVGRWSRTLSDILTNAAKESASIFRII